MSSCAVPALIELSYLRPIQKCTDVSAYTTATSQAIMRSFSKPQHAQVRRSWLDVESLTLPMYVGRSLSRPKMV